MEIHNNTGNVTTMPSQWFEREYQINLEHHDFVVALLEEAEYTIQGEIEIQESDFDYRWEVCDILYNADKTIRKGFINTGYIFDPDSKTMFLRDEF
ncbi:MAG: hypothetical protein R3Y63_14325 [Eubacteriales bacterium]